MSNLKINLDTNNVDLGCVMPDIRKVLQEKLIEDLKQLVNKYSNINGGFIKVSKEHLEILDKKSEVIYKLDKDGLWMKINNDKITL